MEFLLKKDSFKKTLKKHILFQLCITAIILILLYSLLSSILEIYYIIAPLVLIYKLISQTFVIIKMKKEWYTYRILLTKDGIYKTQYKKVAITIMSENIKRIIEIPNSGLSIQTHNEHNYLYIPTSLENYEIIRSELVKWCPIEESIISQPLINAEASQFRLASDNKNSFFKKMIKIIAFLFGGLLVLLFILVLLLQGT
jgi:hypothetical protein